MVDSVIRLRSLSTGELTGIVNIYPWFGGARKELCRRLAREGKASEELFAEMALHIPDRGKVYRLLQDAARRPETTPEAAPARKEVPVRKETPGPKAPAATPRAEAAPREEKPRVRIAGGDYFSQSDYDQVGGSGDNLLKGLKFKAVRDTSDEKPSQDIVDRFQTEALAEIFADQGYPDLAKRIYSKLILVYPEKSAYFASLIEKLD